MEYELVHEIRNHCPNNQMRDVFIAEIEPDDLFPMCRRGWTGTSTS